MKKMLDSFLIHKSISIASQIIPDGTSSFSDIAEFSKILYFCQIPLFIKTDSPVGWSLSFTLIQNCCSRDDTINIAKTQKQHQPILMQSIVSNLLYPYWTYNVDIHFFDCSSDIKTYQLQSHQVLFLWLFKGARIILIT